MPGPLNPNAGDPSDLFKDTSNWLESKVKDVTSADLPAMSDDQFWAQYQQIEQDLEDLLRTRHKYVDGAEMWAKDTAGGFNPFDFDTSALTSDEMAPILARIQRLSGAEHLLNNGITPEFFNNINSRSPGARFRIPSIYRELEDGTREVDPRLLLLSQTVQRYQRGWSPGKQLVDFFAPPKKTLRSGMLKNLSAQLNEGSESFAGKSMTVFDIETASLLERQGLWQFSAHVFTPEGVLDPNKTKNLIFKNFYMENMGAVYNPATQKLESLQDKLIREAIKRDPTVKVTEFGEGFSDIVDALAGSDLIGGHNIPFDIKHIMFAATHHDLYKDPGAKGQKFRSDVERLKAKVLKPTPENPFAISPDFVDSAAWSRALLGSKLELHKDLGGQRKLEDYNMFAHELGQKFNMQNLVMQTDLLERVVENLGGGEIGRANLEALLAHGMHLGDIDVQMEHPLIRSLVEERNNQVRGLQKGAPGAERGLDTNAPLGPQNKPEMIRPIRSSKSTTPTQNIDNVEEVHPLLMERLKAIDPVEGGVNFKGHAKVTPLEQQIFFQRSFEPPNRKMMNIDHPSIWETLTDKTRGSKWERLRAAFWDKPLGLEASAEQLGYSAGVWERATQDWIHYDKEGVGRRAPRTANYGLIDDNGSMPDIEAWHKFQKDTLEDRGIPFAGLSPWERHLTAVLGENWDAGNAAQDKYARDVFGSMTGLAKFKGHHEIGIAGGHAEGKGVVKMPEEVLDEIMQAGQAHGLFQNHVQNNFYELDAFAWPKEEGKELRHEVGFKWNFSSDKDVAKQEQEFILQHLSQHKEHFSESQDPAKVIAQIRDQFEKQNPYGIQVGWINDDKYAKRIHDALENVRGNVIKGTDQTPDFFAARVRGSEANMVAGIVNRPELLKEPEQAAFRQNVEYSAEKFGEARKLFGTRFQNLFEDVKNLRTDAKEVPRAVKMFDASRTLTKRMPVMVAGATSAAGAYYIHRKRKTRDAYEETINPQPTEDASDEPQVQTYPAAYSGQVGRNAISNTGGTMRKLDTNKTRHTKMGPNKNSHLFGGGYT